VANEIIVKILTNFILLLFVKNVIGKLQKNKR